MTERVWIELIESSREFVQYIIMVLKKHNCYKKLKENLLKISHCFQEFDINTCIK